MKAINFNFTCNRMQEGERYTFTHTDAAGVARVFQLSRVRDCVFMFTDGGGEACDPLVIFRERMTVKTAISILCKDLGPAVLTSGEVYKTAILSMNNDNYTKDVNHTVIRSYHGTPRINKPVAPCAYMLGVELELYARNNICYNTLNAIHSNVFHREQDGSLPTFGQEWISCPLLPEDATNPAFWDEYTAVLEQFAMSRSSESCGLHVHISREAFKDANGEISDTLAKVIYMHEQVLNAGQLERVYGRGSVYYARPFEGATGDTKRIADLAKDVPEIIAIKGVQDKIKSDYDITTEHRDRINTSKAATIEFRQGKGHINAEHIARVCQFVDTLVKYCKLTDWKKLNAAKYAVFIPSSHKYDALRRALSDSEE